ncbi:hypothetical protein EYF80_056531 [Liparis tanakae]|uniref:Uncharacterized protein n=1 Tax=Liparis tanakae TaxID=230148 RepID=A0A4Z2EY90_9TELE|nr:hypothetical protein EYF80_056531 [Liparis tanakae]
MSPDHVWPMVSEPRRMDTRPPLVGRTSTPPRSHRKLRQRRRKCMGTVSVEVALTVPSALEATQVYSPESWKLTGWICRPPDCSSVKRGTCTAPLASTRPPGGRSHGVMAGLGAPSVWHRNTAAVPSVTVWSRGGEVSAGCRPAGGRRKGRGGGRSVELSDWRRRRSRPRTTCACKFAVALKTELRLVSFLRPTHDSHSR